MTGFADGHGDGDGDDGQPGGTGAGREHSIGPGVRSGREYAIGPSPRSAREYAIGPDTLSGQGHAIGPRTRHGQEYAIGLNARSSQEHTIGLNTLVRLQRRRPAPDPDRRLPLPDGMTAPLGCDAVGVPDRLGPLVVPRLPRVGCVYADGSHWWWIVPSDSDYALPWPAPAQYAAGALITGSARLIHRPEGTAPYTPPIPLYLALCRVTDTAPDWSRAASA